MSWPSLPVPQYLNIDLVQFIWTCNFLIRFLHNPATTIVLEQYVEAGGRNIEP
jgi:hypothetical protein